MDEVPENTPHPDRAKGGVARREALTPEQRAEIAQSAAMARWGAQKASHEGVLKIGNAEIPCAVLEDGTRLLSRIGFLRAIGRTGKAKGGRRYDQESQVPVFLTADNLKPFITSDLAETSKPVPFRPIRGGSAMGYRPDLLLLVCNVFSDADAAGKLRPNQEHIAEQCRLLMKGFAAVGLAALIDEATGYQEVRNKQALQAILDAFLQREFAAWAKRFPDQFYSEMFRLRKWTWQAVRAQRPPLVGKLTKDLVYERLAPGVLKELEQLNPKNEAGKRKVKHHQFLTADVGHPRLAEHLYGLIGLMRAHDDWEAFKAALDRAYPKRGNNLDLFLEDAI